MNIHLNLTHRSANLLLLYYIHALSSFVTNCDHPEAGLNILSYSGLCGQSCACYWTYHRIPLYITDVRIGVCVCVCVCVCVRACVHACVRACVRACTRLYVTSCVHVHSSPFPLRFTCMQAFPLSIVVCMHAQSSMLYSE